MIRAIMVEDIPSVREQQVALIKQYCPFVSIIAQTDSVVSSLEAINRLQPDVLFLDIDLIDGSAFDLIRQMPFLKAHVVFMTAHNDYAIQAFRLSAIDYLLKPITPAQLVEAVKKVEEKIDADFLALKLSSLLKNVDNQNVADTTLVLKTQEKMYLVKVHDIIRLESDNSYTTFYLNDTRKILVSIQLKEYEELLLGKGFYRPHKSHVINLNYISHIVKVDGAFIVMNDQSQVPLAVRRKEEFFQLIEGIKKR